MEIRAGSPSPGRVRSSPQAKAANARSAETNAGKDRGRKIRDLVVVVPTPVTADVELIAVDRREPVGRGPDSIIAILVDFEVVECGHTRTGVLVLVPFELPVIVAE